MSKNKCTKRRPVFVCYTCHLWLMYPWILYLQLFFNIIGNAVVRLKYSNIPCDALTKCIFLFLITGPKHRSEPHVQDWEGPSRAGVLPQEVLARRLCGSLPEESASPISFFNPGPILRLSHDDSDWLYHSDAFLVAASPLTSPSSVVSSTYSLHPVQLIKSHYEREGRDLGFKSWFSCRAALQKV